MADSTSAMDKMAPWAEAAMYSAIEMLVGGHRRVVYDEDLVDALRAAGVQEHLEPRQVGRVCRWALATMTRSFAQMIRGRHTHTFVHGGHRPRRIEYAAWLHGLTPEVARRAELETVMGVKLNPTFSGAADAAREILDKITPTAPALPPDAAYVVELPPLPPETLSRGGAGGRPMASAARARRYRGRSGYAAARVGVEGMVYHQNAGTITDDATYVDHGDVPTDAAFTFRSLQSRRGPWKGLGKGETP